MAWMGSCDLEEFAPGPGGGVYYRWGVLADLAAEEMGEAGRGEAGVGGQRMNGERLGESGVNPLEGPPDPGVESGMGLLRIGQIAAKEHFLERVHREGFVQATGARIDPDQITKSPLDAGAQRMAGEREMEQPGGDWRPLQQR